MPKRRSAARGKGELSPDADVDPEGWSSRDKFAAWRSACEQENDWGCASTGRFSRTTKDEKKRVKNLERELARNDRALAETAALLVLRKKPGLLQTDQTHSQKPLLKARACSRRTNFWIFPVEVLGMAVSTNVPGTL